MSFLGFVGPQAAKIPYQVFNGLATGTGFGASTLRAGASAAGFGITRAAGLLGLGGALGFFVGQQIVKGLEYTEQPLTIRQLYKTAGNQGNIRVRARAQLTTSGLLEFDNVFPSPIIIPVSLDATGGQYRVGALVGPNSEFVGYYQAAPSQVVIPLEVVTINKENGDPALFRQIPSPPLPTVPFQPLRLPTTVPTLPGQPDFPITPTVIPIPDPPTDEPNKQREPGVLVQIPELGIQLGFYPSGVSIGRYRSPETEPFEEPKVPLPPGNPPPATDECPCKEGENKDDEIICRIKTLQDEILDDGFQTTTIARGPASFLSVEGLPDEFFRLDIEVTQTPTNVKTQFYSADEAKVEWVGYLTWLYGSGKGDRIFLQFRSMSFRPPPECTGYLIAMNNGCLASALSRTRKKKDYVDLCNI